MEKENRTMYYLFGYRVCRETVADNTVTEYYEIGKGWLQDKPNTPSFSNLHRNIRDALRGYGDYSVMDVDVITEETAKRITDKQEEQGAYKIPNLHYGSGAYKE